MRTSTFSRAIFGLLVLALYFIPKLPCQQLATGNISGVVTDPSGRALGNVTVTLTNAAQGTERSYKTGDDGVFSFATLEAAGYNLSAAGPSGFAEWQPGGQPGSWPKPQRDDSHAGRRRSY